jgi:ribosomal protein S19
MLINKELILTHKEFAETIIERLQGKIKEYEEKLNKVKTDTRRAVITGKMIGLMEAIEEMREFIRQLETWYE